MLTKTKIALAAALVAGSASLAFAQFDPNMANRYPGYTSPNASVQQNVAPRGALQSAPVQLQQGRNVGPTSPAIIDNGQTSEFNVDRSDRASSPYAGGGF